MNDADEILKNYGLSWPDTVEEGDDAISFLCGVISSLKEEIKQYDESRKELRWDLEKEQAKLTLTRAYIPLRHRETIEEGVDKVINTNFINEG